MCEQRRIWHDWSREPEWINYKDHRPFKSDVTRAQAIKKTENKVPSRYAGNVNRRQVELDCFNQGVANPELYECTRGGNEDTVIFWMHCEFEVGFSDGEPTEYMVVKFQRQASKTTIHGYPVTETELRDKYGIKL